MWRPEFSSARFLLLLLEPLYVFFFLARDWVSLISCSAFAILANFLIVYAAFLFFLIFYGWVFAELGLKLLKWADVFEFY